MTSLVVTALGALAAFVVFQHELTQRQVRYLNDYVRERSSNIDKRFSNLTSLHTSAVDELNRRLETLESAEVDRLADVYFPLQGDGTRRSRPELFEGHADADGGVTYGMGAFIGRASDISPQDKAILVAAFDVVSGFGQAIHATYDNFYFFTPETRLVMFGPDRPDHLLFYRQNAPAELDISGEEMARITSPSLDPARATRCTNLQRLLQDDHGERLATACLTPVYVKDRYVGALGSSIDLTGFFQDAVSRPLPGGQALVVTGKGELVAYPGFANPGRASPETVAGYEQALGLKHLVAEIAADGRQNGAVISADGKSIVAYGRLSGPDWYLLISYPKALMAASAFRSAVWVLVIGMIAAMLQTMLVVSFARGAIVQPLRRLAATCQTEAKDEVGRIEAADIERRNDELGVLARALRGERDKVEAVLASLEDRVSARTAELERATAEKSRFLANMSHELRTPLNGVIAISETLAQEQTTAHGRELSELIVSSGRLLEQVLTDILDFSKIEAGEITLAHDHFDLRPVVRRIAELHRASAEAKGLKFGWSLTPEADGWFIGDPVRLTQVISNLLSNAVKFTETGSVSLLVEAVSERGLRFAVTDTGIGFDDEVRARLFRRFEQADSSIRRRFGGTGLGLAISRSLVELMGGVVEAASRPGVGSTFTISLSLPRAEAIVAQAEAAPVEIELAGARVLLAEDHPTNQKVVQLILQSVGVEPVIVDNGALALDRLQAERFDVVLMDMQMPELDGLSATARLRAYEAQSGLPRTPVVMLTANAMDEHVAQSLAAGADRHLSKPIHAMSLIQTIAEVIAERAPSAVALQAL